MARSNRPAPPKVPLDLWRELHQAAAQYQLLAPWEWMHDTHLLGIDNEHGIRFLSVLGRLGEIFGLSSNRGTVGINYLLGLLEGTLSPQDPESFYLQDALLMDFVPRKDLRKADRSILEQIGFEPPPVRPKRFPRFYSHRPGYVPWFVDEAEARELWDDLLKVCRFAELLREHPSWFGEHRPFEFPFFPPAIQEPLTPEQFVWHRMVKTPSPEPPIQPERFDTESLAGLPQPAGAAWELDAFYTDVPIGESPRPYWARIALVVDARTGFIVGHKLSRPVTAQAEAAAECLVQSIKRTGLRPGEIRVGSSALAQALVPLAVALRAKLIEAGRLPMLEEARLSLGNFGRF